MEGRKVTPRRKPAGRAGMTNVPSTVKTKDFSRLSLKTTESKTPDDVPTSEISTSEGTNGSVLDIDRDGDLVLEIEHELAPAKTQRHSFRVDSKTIKASSKYFDNLLRPGRFEEGDKVNSRLDSLAQTHTISDRIPTSMLPAISISDVGRTGPIKALDALLTDFLLVLHGKDMRDAPSLSKIAKLVIVADRFDALEFFKAYAHRKRLLAVIGRKESSLPYHDNSEDKARQRLLVGILLSDQEWVEKSSASLIQGGLTDNPTDSSRSIEALWWDLPSRYEEELIFRRESVIETVQVLVAHFLELYTSRARQCKLGYDNSLQCDAFQLGEMVRFFSRSSHKINALIRWQGTLLDTGKPVSGYTGNLNDLLDRLLEVPEYQIDSHHAHCGLRTRMVPILMTMKQALTNIGICLECKTEGSAGSVFWQDGHAPMLWRMGPTVPGSRADHQWRHAQSRALFTASERQWQA